jgi:hypothetical protein
MGTPWERISGDAVLARLIEKKSTFRAEYFSTLLLMVKNWLRGLALLLDDFCVRFG